MERVSSKINRGVPTRRENGYQEGKTTEDHYNLMRLKKEVILFQNLKGVFDFVFNFTEFQKRVGAEGS